MADLVPSYEYFETRFEFYTKNCNNKCYWKVVKGINMAGKVKKRRKISDYRVTKIQKTLFQPRYGFLRCQMITKSNSGPKNTSKISIQSYFLYWKKFQSWCFGFKVQPHHPAWFSFTQKKTFSSHVNACNYLPITFIIAIFCVVFKSGVKILIAGD